MRSLRIYDRDPIDRFRAWMKGKRLWTQKWEDELKEEMLAEIAAAVEAAESTPAPDVETLFDDVYAEVPAMLQEQKAMLLDQIKRSGDIEDTGGAFPL